MHMRKREMRKQDKGGRESKKAINFVPVSLIINEGEESVF